jgi:hypothetical protein
MGRLKFITPFPWNLCTVPFRCVIRIQAVVTSESFNCERGASSDQTDEMLHSLNNNQLHIETDSSSLN